MIWELFHLSFPYHHQEDPFSNKDDELLMALTSCAALGHKSHPIPQPALHGTAPRAECLQSLLERCLHAEEGDRPGMDEIVVQLTDVANRKTGSIQPERAAAAEGVVRLDSNTGDGRSSGVRSTVNI